MTEIEMVVAQCCYCERQFFSWSKEDALHKYESHHCLASLLDKELEELLIRAIEGQTGEG